MKSTINWKIQTSVWRYSSS